MGWDVNCSERVLTGNSSDSYVCNQPKKARGEKHDGIKKRVFRILQFAMSIQAGKSLGLYFLRE